MQSTFHPIKGLSTGGRTSNPCRPARWTNCGAFSLGSDGEIVRDDARSSLAQRNSEAPSFLGPDPPPLGLLRRALDKPLSNMALMTLLKCMNAGEKKWWIPQWANDHAPSPRADLGPTPLPGERNLVS